jgi:hypothetical protein
MDQVNPEHINRETAEFSWDDLSKVPFRGNQQRSSKGSAGTAGNLKNLIDSLPTDDETIKSKREEEARQRVQAILHNMDSIGSFGENARNGNKISDKGIFRTPENIKDDNIPKNLSDISKTF